MSQQPYKVEHNRNRKRFEIKFDNGDEALIEYNVHGNEYDFYHTYVPDSQRGKGIADFLADGAMDWIVKNPNSKAILSCSYLSNRWLPKNPQFARYVIKGFTGR
eukprot:gene667-826_t